MRSVISPVLVAAVGERRVGSSTSPIDSSIAPRQSSNGPGDRQRRMSSDTATPSRNLDDARTDLRHHDLVVQLDGSQSRLAGLERTVAALDTWRRWADGGTINVEGLRDAVEALTTGHGIEHDGQHRALVLRDPGLGRNYRRRAAPPRPSTATASPERPRTGAVGGPGFDVRWAGVRANRRWRGCRDCPVCRVRRVTSVRPAEGYAAAVAKDSRFLSAGGRGFAGSGDRHGGDSGFGEVGLMVESQ